MPPLSVTYARVHVTWPGSSGSAVSAIASDSGPGVSYRRVMTLSSASSAAYTEPSAASTNTMNAAGPSSCRARTTGAENPVSLAPANSAAYWSSVTGSGPLVDLVTRLTAARHTPLACCVPGVTVAVVRSHAERTGPSWR